jgi:hypothetical protein
LLEHFRVGELRAQSFEIAGDGVALGALGGEGRLAGLSVAHQDGGREIARGVVAVDSEAVQEGGDIGDLGGVEIEFGHAGIGAAVLHDGRDELAVLVIEDELGADQIRSALSAAGVGAVTEGAVDSPSGLAAVDNCGVGRRVLRIGCAEAASTSSATAATGRRRRLCEDAQSDGTD